MKRSLSLLLACALCSLAACGNTNDGDITEKQRLVQDGDRDWCAELGLPDGCDLCAELGFYGDGQCDQPLIDLELCVGPDVDCQSACGNGIVEPGEQCDDGNATDGDGCAADCTLETGTEDCSNGIDDDLDGLVDCGDPDCAGVCGNPAMCGDGVLDPGEQCDDGNSVDGDGCSSVCLIETQPPTEECSNRVDDDADGLIDCDDPDCASSCTFPVCGNGIVEAGEECDDGNSVDGDGCSSLCVIETTCQPSPESCGNSMDDDCDGLVDCADPDCASQCAALCGNGIVDPGEECDDGNSQSGDGCDPDCTFNTGGEDCRNGIDDDQDGLVDCADPDCAVFCP